MFYKKLTEKNLPFNLEIKLPFSCKIKYFK